jgi:hypothetical protein
VIFPRQLGISRHIKNKKGISKKKRNFGFTGISRTKTEFQEFLGISKKKTEFHEFLGISGIFRSQQIEFQPLA